MLDIRDELLDVSQCILRLTASFHFASRSIRSESKRIKKCPDKQNYSLVTSFTHSNSVTCFQWLHYKLRNEFSINYSIPFCDIFPVEVACTAVFFCLFRFWYNIWTNFCTHCSLIYASICLLFFFFGLFIKCSFWCIIKHPKYFPILFHKMSKILHPLVSVNV